MIGKKCHPKGFHSLFRQTKTLVCAQTDSQNTSTQVLVFSFLFKQAPTYFPTGTVTQTVTLSNLKAPQNFQVNESQILEGDNMGKKSINTHDILIQNISFFLFFLHKSVFLKYRTLKKWTNCYPHTINTCLCSVWSSYQNNLNTSP